MCISRWPVPGWQAAHSAPASSASGTRRRRASGWSAGITRRTCSRSERLAGEVGVRSGAAGPRTRRRRPRRAAAGAARARPPRPRSRSPRRARRDGSRASAAMAGATIRRNADWNARHAHHARRPPGGERGELRLGRLDAVEQASPRGARARVPRRSAARCGRCARAAARRPRARAPRAAGRSRSACSRARGPRRGRSRGHRPRAGGGGGGGPASFSERYTVPCTNGRWT